MADKKYKIASLGLHIDDDDISNIDFSSKNSLLDSDVIWTFPQKSFIPITSARYNHNKRPLFDGIDAFQKQLHYWYETLLMTLNKGRVVICFIEDLQHYYLQMPRGKKIMNQVLSMIPYADLLNITEGGGKEMANIAGKEFGHSIKDLKQHLEYKVTFDTEFGVPLLSTRKKEATVGIAKRVGNGMLIVLPQIRNNSFTKEVIKSLKEFSRNAMELTSNEGKSNAPDWVKGDKFTLIEETNTISKIKDLERKEIEVTNEITKTKETLLDVVQIKALLYESGDFLEDVVTQALGVLGLKSKGYRKDSLEIDHVITESNGTILIGESEGTETKAVNDKKVTQLYSNLANYQAIKNLSYLPKGILFGNATRRTHPDKRTLTFTKSCHEKAPNLNILLINTVDLYHAAKHILDSNDDKYAKKCVKAIVDAKGGPFTFPDIGGEV